ncbi:MAG: tetratricopeptide repeat protein, partial [Pyrinomonadaceae bacterium]
VQDRVAEQVAEALMLKLTSEEQKLIRKHDTEDTEAFKAYLKGRHFWNKRTIDGLKKAIDYANRAIDIDPTYAPAYVGLADSYNLLAGHGGLSPKETFPKARAAALRALEIDDNLAEAHNSLALVKFRFDWDYAGGEEEYKRAIEMKPDYATAHHWYGECLAMLGRFDESIAELKTAMELDPLSLPINTDLGQSYFFARQYDRAIEQLKKALDMDPNFIRARVLLGAAYEQKWMQREAVAELRKASEMEAGTNTLALSGLGHAYAVNGQREEARQVLAEMKGLSTRRYVSAYGFAIVHAGLGERIEALEWLQKSYESKCVWMVWLKVNPRFDGLRAEPLFQELLRKLGLVT